MSLVAVADVGTCSTKVLIGELEKGVISLAGVGKSKTNGVKNGRIVKPGSAGKSLKEATKRAEEMASERIQTIHLGARGNLLRFSTNEATITITSGDRIVTRKDVARLMDLVSSVDVGINEKIVSTIPRGFTLDGQEGVTNPVGLQGRRLDLVATLVTIDDKWVENFGKTASRAGYELGRLLPVPQCKGELLLTEEERRRGKALIDLGEETTELLAFKTGAMVDNINFSLGGKNLTGDLAAKFNITSEEARRIKHGFDFSEPGVRQSNPGEIQGNRDVGKESDVFSTLSARTQEIFELILSRARDRGHEQLLGYGVKITGGSSRLGGLTEFLNNKFDLQFEHGSPTGPIAGIKDVVEDPSYGPVLGMLNCALDERFESNNSASHDSEEFRFYTWIRKGLRTIFTDS